MTEDILALEGQIIGAILSTPTLYRRAAFLPSDAFQDKRHRVLWEAIVSLNASGQEISPATLATLAPQAAATAGGLSALNRLSASGARIVTVFNEALDRLYDELQWRRIETLSARLSQAATDRETSPNKVLSSLSELALRHLSGGRSTATRKRDVARAAIADAQNRGDNFATGIDSLDLLLQGGFQTRRLYGIGALFGRGKTILLGSISDNLNLQEAPHLFISLETPPEDIEIRSCAKHLNLNSAAVHDTNHPDYARLQKTATAYLDAIPDYTVYDYAPHATIDEIHRKILAAKAEHGIRGFIVDYWQLIRGRGRTQSEDSHMRDVADRLAAICRQEDLWGVVTAQVDERGRLRVSDALYQSASLYLRLVREENESAAYLVTEKSNYTRYADTGSESIPTIIFDDHVGPHFRNVDPEDAGRLPDADT